MTTARALSIVVLVLTGGTLAAQGADAKPSEKRASLSVLISAEDRPAIPAGSKIRWEAADETCKGEQGELILRPKEPTPLTLPICKLRFTIFVTGFATRAVTIDLVGNEKKFSQTIHITMKSQGDPVVDWPNPPDPDRARDVGPA